MKINTAIQKTTTVVWLANDHNRDQKKCYKRFGIHFFMQMIAYTRRRRFVEISTYDLLMVMSSGGAVVNFYHVIDFIV